VNPVFAGFQAFFTASAVRGDLTDLVKMSTRRHAANIANSTAVDAVWQGQTNSKARLSRPGIELDLSAVREHNAAHGIKSKPGSFSYWFGREEWFEDMVFDIGRNSRAIINNIDFGELALAGCSD
jgi:hypothetical protein